jgi:hypothetical protein
VLLLALMLRIAVPSGWMLSPDGALAIVPCPASAPAPAAHPGHHAMAGHGAAMTHAGGHDGPARHDPATHASQACPYAALSAPMLPPEPPVAVGAESQAIPATAPARAEAPPVAALAAPPPPARGPPALS